MTSGNLIRFHCYGISHVIYSLSACNFYILYFNLFQPSVAFHIETSELKWGNFLVIHYAFTCRGVAPRGGRQVQQIQFQTSEILLFTGVQKLYRPEISRFSPCMLQFLDNIQQLLTFSIYRAEIDYFSLDFLKRSEI